jgi:hypothetical protein
VLFVSGPTIATAQLYVVNRYEPAILVTNHQAIAPEQFRITYHARRFEFAAAPTRLRLSSPNSPDCHDHD